MEDKLKKLFQNIELEEPAAGFTDHIMKMVEEKEPLSLSPALLPVVKNELLVEPSLQFANNLMANIQPKLNKIAEPIITKKAWLVLSGLVVLLPVLLLIYTHSTITKLQNNFYFSRFTLNLSGTTTTIIKVSGSILPYLIPLGVLLLMDYFFRNRQRHLSTGKQHH